ncbi:hypothetical protein ACFY3M_53200 [Streptomyces mirabilis]|uniref:hypothetical protein n=1 Tax=Streptomyces mirabilis TaxID=68239 RepID=UPI0036C4CEC4
MDSIVPDPDFADALKVAAVAAHDRAVLDKATELCTLTGNLWIAHHASQLSGKYCRVLGAICLMTDGTIVPVRAWSAVVIPRACETRSAPKPRLSVPALTSSGLG